MKILLDYVFPISIIEAIPQASTAFLKQVAVVAKPKAGQEANVGQLFECSSMTDVNVRIANTNGAVDEVQQLFNAGMSKVYILLSDDVDENLADYLEEHAGVFFTLLISSDFGDSDIGTVETAAVKAEVKIQDILFRAKTAGVAGNSITVNYNSGGTAGAEVVGVVGSDITVTMEDGVSTADNIRDAIEASVPATALVDCVVDSGDEDDAQDVFGAAVSLAGGVDLVAADGDAIDKGTFDGVIGVATTDEDVAAVQSVVSNRSVWFKLSGNKGKNMFYAFGKLLSNLVSWHNQQYIEMPFNDEVELLGDANSLFDDKVSFVINDDEFGNRLALFCAGGKAIAAPYILKNLRVDMQSRAVSWIALNQPQYTKKEAALLETRIQEDVINSYITLNWIESGTIEITLQEENFVATGEIEVPTPKALWRVFSEMTES